jgi:tetratricopeptide (TPR) repeat protein
LVKENRLEEAIACLTETIERHPQDASTRRRLATLLANRSFDEDWEKVASLLSPNAQSNTPEDLRLQVILLSQKNDLASLQKAQVLLERIVELPGVRTDEDYFQLASLYLRSSRFLEATPGREIEAAQATEAAGRLLKLVASGASPKPENIYTYANYLIGQKRFFDAVEESQKLETIAPDAFPTFLLKARITKLEGNAQGALNIIQAWIADKRQLESSSNNPTKLAGFLVQAGQALQILDANEQSQKLLLEAYKLDKRAGINYIRSILLTDDTATRNNAVRFLMDQLKSEGSNESAILLSLLVRKGDTDEQLMTQAQAQLVSYSVEQQEDRKLLQSLADLWVWRGNESQAIETFRRIVQDRPNDAVALNNLAMLLADAPNGSQEAMQCIDRAIALIGPNPSLLDSKAYVLIRSNKPNEAIAILKTLRTKNDSPSVRFHLYQAYVQSNAVELAKEILSTIDPKTLRKFPLPQVDQQELEKLEKSLSVSPEQPAS